jgi:hypothetical protein
MKKMEEPRIVRTDSMASSFQKANIVTCQINTDIPGKTFWRKIKIQALTNEKSEYSGVKKMLVISDIFRRKF